MLGGDGVVRAVAKRHGPGRVDVGLEAGVAQDPDQIRLVVLSTCSSAPLDDARPSRLPRPARGRPTVTALMPAEPRKALERSRHQTRRHVIAARGERDRDLPRSIVGTASPGRPAPGPVRSPRRRYSASSSPARRRRSRWKAASSRLIPNAEAASSRPSGSRRRVIRSYSRRRFGSSSRASASIGSAACLVVGHARTLTETSTSRRLDSAGDAL